MKNFAFLLLSLIAFSSLNAQSLKKGDQKKFDKAKEDRNQGNYQKAIESLDKLIESYPNLPEIYVEKGLTAIESKNFELVIESLTKADELLEKKNPKLLFTIANAYYQLDDFDQAISYLDRVLAIDKLPVKQVKTTTKAKNRYEFTKNAIENPVDFEPEKLNEAINTEDHEYKPSFTADGSTLIFTRKANGAEEDLYESQILNDTFLMSFPIKELNSANSEGSHCISADGQYLFFTGCNFPGSIGGCDLYITRKSSAGWIKPVNLGQGINTGDWDSQPSITALGDRLYFTSTRKGGSGKSDIWYSDFENGQWSEPQNLGPEINSTGNDESPFIHPDGKTMYFRSDGHVGLGDFDIFMSKYEDDEWSTPVNIGYPINTKGNDGALTVSIDGHYAYYASDMGHDNLDIYRFKLPEELKPEPVSFIKLIVIDAITKKPLDASLKIFDLSTNKNYLQTKTDSRGTAIGTLIAGKQYSIYIEKEGYLFYSENLEWLEENSQLDPTIVRVMLNAIPKKEMVKKEKESEPVILKNIFFESGSAEILSKSAFEIQKLYDILIAQKDADIIISGHTDNVGSEQDNIQLSKARAESVKNELVELGISDIRIRTKGRGESMPIATNDTKEDRILNRRVDFRLVYK